MKLSATPDDHLATRRAEKSQGFGADWRRWSRAERLAVVLAGLATLGLAAVIPFID
jgi:hypothetical protein